MTTGYSEIALDHIERPHNVGAIEDADGMGMDMNPVCGDMLTFFIKVQDGRILDAKHQIKGCAGTQAASSVLTELVIGKTLEEAAQVNNQAIIEALGGLPVSKLHSAALAEVVLKKALAHYRSKG